MAPVAHDLDGIAGQQRAAAIGAAGPVQHGAAGKMAAAADQGQARRDLALVAVPIDDRLIGSHHPRAIVAVQVDRGAAEGAAPLDHGAIEMRVRDRDRIDAALRLDRAQRPPRRSGSCSPTARCRRCFSPATRAGRSRNAARCRRRSRPASSSRTTTPWLCCRSRSVVQRWPSQPTNWRSSVQIGHAAGASLVSANCTPQVTQIGYMGLRGPAEAGAGRGPRPEHPVAPVRPARLAGHANRGFGAGRPG